VIIVYRIVKKKWSNTAFDGEGARLYGGRWNSKGNSCVYVASSESLAILEMLVHLEHTSAIDNYTLYSIVLQSSDVMLLDNDSLPDNWQDNPAPAEVADLGDEWLTSQTSLALAVPSTIVPRELNYILNTTHPNYEKLITTASKLNINFDARLFN